MPISVDFYKDIDNIKCDKVTFHIIDKPADGPRLFGSVFVNHENYLAATDIAEEIIDDTLTEMTLLYGRPFKLINTDYYVTPKTELETDITLNNNSVHRISMEFKFGYRIGGNDADEISLKMKFLDSNKKNCFKKAIGYYREAIQSSNPYTAISNYFSSISTIVRDVTGYNEIRQSNLKNHIKNVIGDSTNFDEQFDKFYKKGRNATTHGHIEVLDRITVKEVLKNCYNLKQWTRKVLIDYLDKNQIPHS